MRRLVGILAHYVRGCCCGGCAGVPERRRGQLKKIDDVSPTEERGSDEGHGARATAGHPSDASANSAASNVPYIGKAVVIKGELNGSEDIIIDGQFEGRIELRDHTLTVGRNARIKADLIVKSVDILGRVTGNVTAVDMVRIRQCGTLNGNIEAPRVVIAGGANFRGRVDTPRAGGDLHDGAPVKAPAPPAWQGSLKIPHLWSLKIPPPPGESNDENDGRWTLWAGRLRPVQVAVGAFLRPR